MIEKGNQSFRVRVVNLKCAYLPSAEFAIQLVEITFKIDKSCFLFYSNDTKPLAFVSPYGSSEEQVSDKRGFT